MFPAACSVRTATAGGNIMEDCTLSTATTTEDTHHIAGLLKNSYLSEDAFATTKSSSRNSSRNFYTASFSEQRPRFQDLLNNGNDDFNKLTWNVDATVNNIIIIIVLLKKMTTATISRITTTLITRRMIRIVEIMVIKMTRNVRIEATATLFSGRYNEEENTGLDDNNNLNKTVDDTNNRDKNVTTECN
jgi:hypothetical protein